MFDVITFGSATSDTFLRLLKNTPLDRSYLNLGKEICFPLGAKSFIDDLQVHSGGGGTNSLVSFLNLGFKAAYFGKVGDDLAGKNITNDLRKLSARSFRPTFSFLKKENGQKTAASVILSSAEGERTVLIFRGACHTLQESDIPWKKLRKTKWFYLAPLSDKSSQVFPFLIKFAKENRIKLACNPGGTQLRMKKEILEPLLSQVDVLIMNLEEAGLLTGLEQAREMAILERLLDLTPGIVAITKGKDGALVSEGKKIFRSGVVPVKVVERTGAGDAFGSGFLAGLFLKNEIEYAIRLATANAAFCIGQVGAKNGLLKKAQLADLPQTAIKTEALG